MGEVSDRESNAISAAIDDMLTKACSCVIQWKLCSTENQVLSISSRSAERSLSLPRWIQQQLRLCYERLQGNVDVFGPTGKQPGSKVRWISNRGTIVRAS